MNMDPVNAVMVSILLIVIVSLPFLLVFLLCHLGLKVTNSLDSPTAKSATKGVVGAFGTFWLLRKAAVAKTDGERALYHSLADEALELVKEANDELEGKKKSGKFYHNPDWWKKGDDDQEPPQHSRWN